MDRPRSKSPKRTRCGETLPESPINPSLLDVLPGMVYRCRNEPDWPPEYVSEGCLALTGYTPRQLVGPGRPTYGQLIHPDDRARVWGEVQTALALEEPFEITYRIRSRHSGEKNVWERGHGVCSEAGEILALEGFIVELSEDTGPIAAMRRTRGSTDEIAQLKA